MLSKFSVKKPYTVLVGVILIVVLGIVSFNKMSADLLPDINLPYVVVMTTYVGASPETVESVVTEPVESSMATVSNIESVTSMSAENYSVVILEFAQTADMDSVSLEIRENLDQLESYWDDSVGSPIIMKINPNMLPQMIAAVGVEGMTDAEVSDFAEENVIPRLESLEGVASVTATGLIEDSVQVIIREDKIAEVNEKVSALIDEKFEEAYEEIADGYEEIENSESELEKAEKELNNGQSKLNSAKKQVADGKTELTNKKDSTLEELSEAKLKVLAAKSDLEAAKTNLNTNVTTAQALYKGYTQLAAAVPLLETAWNGTNVGTEESPVMMYGLDTTDSRTFYFTTVENSMDAYQTALSDYTAKATDLATKQADYAAGGTTTADDVSAAETALSTSETALTTAATALATNKAMLTDSSSPYAMLLSDSVKKSINALDFTASTAKASYDELMQTYYSETYSTYTTTKAQYASVANQLTGLVGGTDETTYKNYIKTQNSAISSIASNIDELDKKILELYQGESDALIQFANGLSQLDLTEYQLSVNQSSIDSGKSEMESGKESISEAKEQLADAETQLEDSKAEAKEQADMSAVLTVDTVSALLTAQNFSMPAGYVEEDGDSYLIRVGDKPVSIDELKELPLMKVPMSEDDEIITLGDVADVFLSSNTGEVYTNVNGKPGIILSLQKQTGYSTGDVSDTINDEFENLKEDYPDLTLISLMDQGVYIDLVMDTIVENVLVGALLAVIVLIFFLRDIRPTLIIAISIPVSLITAVVCMYFSGVTLNIISLSGLALGVGMLVDNSIVVIENIYRMRNEGMEIKQAAVEGSREVSGAIFASTLTTVSVFLPIVFTEGITRQLFVDMGLTIAYSLLASLIVALTVVPAMASKTLKKVKKQKEHKNGGFMGAYRKFLSGCLKVKPVILLLAAALLGVSIWLELKRGTAYFPDMASTQVTVTVTKSEDSELKTVSAETDELIDKLLELDDVTDAGAMASSSTLSLLGGMSTDSSDTTSTTIYVTTVEDRSLSNDELVAAIQDCAAGIEGIDVDVETSTMDMSALGGSGISLEIKGRDLDTLYSLAEQAAEIMRNTEGVGKVTDATTDSDPELRITIDKEEAVKYGLTVAQVYQQIYPHLQDASASTTLSTSSEDLSVYVEDESDTTMTLKRIKNMMITYTDSDGEEQEVALSDIATFTEANGLATINRSGQTRYVSVSAELADGYNIGLVSNDVEKNMEALELPDGYSYEFTGENEMITEAISQLSLMLVLAVVFIYLIMVAQFQSLLSPFIIMFTIPLAFTGGFAALYFTNNEISIVSMIGFVMLSGIIVNNGIVLVDYINQRREAGMAKREAILDAGVTRLRPVLMTALTTILALLTMAFSTKMGADMSRPLAIVVIGGMVYGTLMTLVVVPCIYDIFSREKKGAGPAGPEGDELPDSADGSRYGEPDGRREEEILEEYEEEVEDALEEEISDDKAAGRKTGKPEKAASRAVKADRKAEKARKKAARKTEKSGKGAQKSGNKPANPYMIGWN